MGSRIGAIIAGMKQKGTQKGQVSLGSSPSSGVKIPRPKGVGGQLPTAKVGGSGPRINRSTGKLRW